MEVEGVTRSECEFWQLNEYPLRPVAFAILIRRLVVIQRGLVQVCSLLQRMWEVPVNKKREICLQELQGPEGLLWWGGRQGYQSQKVRGWEDKEARRGTLPQKASGGTRLWGQFTLRKNMQFVFGTAAVVHPYSSLMHGSKLTNL